jgi:hypothetical protein
MSQGDRTYYKPGMPLSEAEALTFAKFYDGWARWLAEETGLTYHQAFDSLGNLLRDGQLLLSTEGDLSLAWDGVALEDIFAARQHEGAPQ